MEFECGICKRKFNSEASMRSHKGWHKRYQKKFETKIRSRLRRLRRLKKKATKKSNTPKTKKVKFKIGKSVKSLTVRLCKPNGQCLFEALWFQTAAKHYDYNKNAIQEFKNSILTTIENDKEYYKPFLEAHLADLNGKKYWGKYVNANEKAKRRMRDELMKDIRTGKEWGAIETIAAVQDMYNVNCVSFDANDETFRMAEFQKECDKIVLVSFSGFNHYDTVIDINGEDIPKIAKELAKRAV